MPVNAGILPACPQRWQRFQVRNFYLYRSHALGQTCRVSKTLQVSCQSTQTFNDLFDTALCGSTTTDTRNEFTRALRVDHGLLAFVEK